MNALVSTEKVKGGTHCTFLLPKLYQVPPYLSRATSQECATAFQIADQVLASQEKLCLEEYASSITNDIHQRQQQEVDKLILTHKKELQKLENDTKSNVQYLEASLVEQEKRFLKQITDLEVQLQRASTSQDILRTQFLEEAERRIQQQKDSDMLMIDHLRLEAERLRQEAKELEIRLQARISVQSNSSKRGTEGEQLFHDIVKERKGWNLVCTAKTGHSADYYTTLAGVQIRFEVKNYTYVIPTKEVNKLRDDMREHPETDIGVFVSLNTEITFIPTISLEWTPTNQLIVFLPSFLQQDIDIVLHFLDLVFQTLKPYRSMLSKGSKQNELPIFKERIDRALIYAQNGLSRITQSLNTFTLDVRALQNKIDDMISHTKANIIVQKEELQSMIAILSGQDIELEQGEEPDALPVVHLKKKTTRAKKKNNLASMDIE